jgi:biotin operon repressor
VKLKTKEMAAKAKNMLTGSDGYMPANVLAEHLGMAPAGVYRLIRILREGGTGILPTPKGYVLSEYANKTDDVHFMRRLNGRRTSDMIALRAAEPDIRKRWSSVEDRRSLKLITAPLHVELATLDQGHKILLKTQLALKEPVLKVNL